VLWYRSRKKPTPIPVAVRCRSQCFTDSDTVNQTTKVYMEVALPRKPRLFLPDQPQHIVVRGHNRDAILVRDDDFRFLYKCLRDAAKLNSLAIHAWVFMHNHLHLLATPCCTQSLPKTMQSVGRRYAQYFNRCYQRSGALWEGRYKCSLVDTDRYLLSCYQYIELNPVRATIVKKPENYPYSSYHANALGKVDSMVTPHEVFVDFVGGSVSGEKVSESKKTDSDTGGFCARGAYRALCAEMLDRKALADIRRGTEKGLGIGAAEFLLKVAGMR
jgi:REP-associated tyrosine transposase